MSTSGLSRSLVLSIFGTLVFGSPGLFVAACSARAPAAPTAAVGGAQATHVDHNATAQSPSDANSGAHDDRGYIDGWFEGRTVQLYYTKTFYCAEPPVGNASDTDCEIGAAPETPPRPGPIPTIYAIAAAFQPPPDTAACIAGSPCLNHPAHIDISRIVPGVTNSTPLSHSHVLAQHAAGWFNTVNIRVFDLETWNQIAEAKTLAKVRELQADPDYGGKGRISQDTPTNIYFFIASWR